jgi:hypothetical protein
MYYQGKLCVPLDLCEAMVQDKHESGGHVGQTRLLHELKLHYLFPPSIILSKLIKKVRSSCLVCQKCDKPNWQKKGPIEFHPIPEKVMSSVGIDIFALPATTWEEQQYDCMVLCIDRLSGWVIARPSTKLGLTGSKAAHLLLDAGWDWFGIPHVITSDQGTQFVSSWWTTMCARLGIRHAYSQAHRPQANGKAERAGQSIIDLLRRLNQDEGINWVEALPRVLTQYHDLPGPSGLSPFNIMFGRHRNLPNLPHIPTRTCEDATQFLDRMEQLDQSIAQQLDKLHKQQADHINESRTEKLPYQPGTQVWLYKQKTHSAQAKLESRWHGPMTVIKRVSRRCYDVKDLHGIVHNVHIEDLKPYINMEPQGHGTLLAFKRDPSHHRKPITKIGEVQDHRQKADGTWEFLVHWTWNNPAENVWESPSLFIEQGLLPYLLHYCQRHNLNLTLMDLLPPTPPDPTTLPDIDHGIAPQDPQPPEHMEDGIPLDLCCIFAFHEMPRRDTVGQ